MFQWLEKTLSGYPLILNNSRCEYQSQWIKWYETYVEDEDDLIFLLGNHDHIFYANGTEYFQSLVKRYKEIYGKTDSSLIFTHYPEMLGKTIHTPLIEDMFFVDNFVEPASCQIFTSVTYKKFWMEGKFEDMFLPRADWPPHGCPNAFNPRPIVVPKIELVRHFDGYTHGASSIDMNKFYFGYPLEIPTGIFENQLKLCIGYIPDPSLTCIDATIESKVNDINGTHYQGVYADCPFFWKNLKTNLVIKEGYDEDSPEVISSNRNIITNAIEAYAKAMGREKNSDITKENIQKITRHYLQ